MEDLLYLDFEGFENKTPSFVGLKSNGVFTQYCFDPIFSSEKIPIKNRLKYQKYDDFVLSKYEEKKKIVVFTRHEIIEFQKVIGTVDEDKFIDAHKKYKRFINSDPQRYKKYRETCEGMGSKVDWSLKNMLKFSGYDIPEPYGRKKVTKWIESVITGVNSRGELTPTQKRNLTNVLRHNKTDVEGMEHLFQSV